MQNLPPQQPPFSGQPPRRPQIFAPVASLAELKDQSEGRILRYGEEIRGRRRVLQKLQDECSNLANAAHHAMQNPQMTPEQRARAATDVDMLGKWYTMIGQALEINRQYLEDIVQTEFVLQSIAQRWVAGMPADPSLLEILTGPQPQQPEQQSPVPEPEPQPQPQAQAVQNAQYIPPPHRVVPMPPRVAMGPQRQPAQPQIQHQTQTQSQDSFDDPNVKANSTSNTEPRTAS
jgi:hypothetical protein